MPRIDDTWSETTAPVARGDDLYFAIHPDQPARTRIAALTEQVRREHGLSGRPVVPEGLHISLQWAGEITDQPAALLAAAKRIGAAIASPAFLVSFDRVLPFKGRDATPIVLATSEELIALEALQAMLGTEIEKAGLGRRRRSRFTPHVTLLYEARDVPETVIEPISWMVREFVLVQNRRGHGRYIVHASWPLRAFG